MLALKFSESSGSSRVSRARVTAAEPYLSLVGLRCPGLFDDSFLSAGDYLTRRK